MPSRVYTERMAAKYLGCPLKWIKDQRKNGNGPEGMKVGTTIVYDQHALDVYRTVIGELPHETMGRTANSLFLCVKFFLKGMTKEQAQRIQSVLTADQESAFVNLFDAMRRECERRTRWNKTRYQKSLAKLRTKLLASSTTEG